MGCKETGSVLGIRSQYCGKKEEAIMLEILLLSLAATLACGAILGTGMFDLSKDDPGKDENR
jgi:hypothetical protein